MPAADSFAGRSVELDSPAVRNIAVTTHDTDELSFVTRGIWVGGAGNVKITDVAGNATTFVGALAGSIIPCRAKIIWATGTTATSLVAMS